MTDQTDPALPAGVVRTPDDRFEDLPGWDFSPNYTMIATDGDRPLRLHHVDEGPADAAPILCMHGEPSWSYLYRHMIPVLTAAGHRVVAPDLIGFGRSDKLVGQDDYTYAAHVEWITEWVTTLDLRDITLVCQDWGGLIGLRVAAENPERFARIVVANTGLATGDQRITDAFLSWQEFSQTTPVFDSGAIVQMGTVTELPDEVVAAYNAPFPDDSYLACARKFPTLVPTTPDDPASDANRAAWKVYEQWTKPFLVAFSDKDAITRGGEKPFRERVPSAAEQPETVVRGGGHFLQEDEGPQFARIINDFIERTPGATS